MSHSLEVREHKALQGGALQGPAVHAGWQEGRGLHLGEALSLPSCSPKSQKQNPQLRVRLGPPFPLPSLAQPRPRPRPVPHTHPPTQHRTMLSEFVGQRLAFGATCFLWPSPAQPREGLAANSQALRGSKDTWSTLLCQAWKVTADWQHRARGDRAGQGRWDDQQTGRILRG